MFCRLSLLYRSTPFDIARVLSKQIAARDSKNKEFTSNSGGWCIKEVKDAREHEQGGLHKTDKGLASALAKFFKGTVKVLQSHYLHDVKN